MPEEKPLIIDPILAQLSRLDEKLDAYQERVEMRFKQVEEHLHNLESRFGERMARLEGGFEQMDKRVSSVEQRMANIEQLQRWALGLIVTSWLSIMLTILLKL